jgi:hypothetical protein
LWQFILLSALWLEAALCDVQGSLYALAFALSKRGVLPLREERFETLMI